MSLLLGGGVNIKNFRRKRNEEIIINSIGTDSVNVKFDGFCGGYKACIIT